MKIREATKEDFEQIWEIFHEVVAKGETYAYDQNTSKDEAFKLWIEMPRKTYVCEDDGIILGTYYLKTNQQGNGDHVCNCGYMVAAKARKKGIATLMCEHSLDIAKYLNYKAMQFNFVISTNVGAIKLWEKFGFETVGTLPKAFNHPTLGYVDALVMYKIL